MKLQERLKIEQPIVYHTLHNALKEKKLAHAFMFVGPKGTPTRQTALLLAQSLVCESPNGNFGCEECNACKRIEEGNYTDLIILDGQDRSIKKDEVLAMQERFSKTGLERSGKKVYILDHAENTTPEALNSLLKFLEEPQGSDILAILIVENQDRILPTIVSRCQILPFRPLTQRQIFERTKEEGIDETDSYLLSHMIRDLDQIKQVSEDEAYQNGVIMMKRFVQELPLREEEVLVWMQNEILGSKEKDKNKKIVSYFLDCCLQFYRDMAAMSSDSPAWMQKEMMASRQAGIKTEGMILCLLETRDKLQRAYNLPLLVDQLVVAIKKEGFCHDSN